MEDKLEQLLNSLIEKGWIPFGDEKIHSFKIIYVTGEIWNIVARRGRGRVNKHYSIIELCSKSSGLWQFVCENGMVELTEYYGVCNWMFGENKYYDETETEKFYTHRDYEYRLIESALKDESELESFILDNIKV